jgi:hypothetical protein
MKESDFREFVKPLTGKSSQGKWDYRVTVQRLTDGATRTIKVSGGIPIIEIYAQKLRRELESNE